MDPPQVVTDSSARGPSSDRPSPGDPTDGAVGARAGSGPPDDGAVVEGPVTLRLTPWSLVRAVLVVAAGLLAVGVAVAAGTVLWWLAIATVLAGAFHPIVTWLRQRMPAWLAIIIVLVGAIAFVGLVGYRGVAELSAQFEVLRSNALDAARDIQASRQFGQVAAEFGLVDKTTSFLDSVPVVVVGGRAEGGAAATVQTAASSGSALFAIATFAVLMLIFGSRFVQAALAQIDDPTVRRRVGALVLRAYHDSYRYAWLMAARAVVIGVLGGLLCAALGLETPTVLGVVFAVMSLIPGLGIVLAAVPVTILTAIGSVPTGVVVIVGALIAQALETSFVQRRIDEETVHVGPTPTLVAALLGLQLYGLGGLLVGLATAVYGLAVLFGLTRAHDEVYTAVRQLVGEPGAAAGESAVEEPEPQEAPQDAVPEAPQDAVPEAPQDAVPEAPQDAVPEAPQDAVPEAHATTVAAEAAVVREPGAEGP
jgi:predicted PurR-regulated permease PerM